MCVLGAVLCPNGQDLLDRYVEAGLTAKDFYSAACGEIFTAMLAIRQANRPVDLLTVPDYMERNGSAVERIFLEQLVDDTPTTAYAEHYMRIVKADSLRRKLIFAGHEIVEKAHESADDAELLRAKAEADIAGLRHDDSQATDTRHPLDRQIEVWEKAQHTRCAGIPTGFSLLDRYFGGLMEAALYVFSGPAGAGKTTLARNIAENVAMRGIPADYITLEQTSEQIWGAVAARHAKQSMFRLNQGHVLSDLCRVKDAAKTVKEWPLYVDDASHTPVTLQSRARRMTSKRGVKLIVIDYLQAIHPARRYDSQEQQITDYSATCRDIAKTLRVPVIIISALSNEGRTRGSGMVSYDAWAHIEIRKAQAWTPQNLIYDTVFHKQRFGPPATNAQLELVGNEQRFKEVNEEESHE